MVERVAAGDPVESASVTVTTGSRLVEVSSGVIGYVFTVTSLISGITYRVEVSAS